MFRRTLLVFLSLFITLAFFAIGRAAAPASTPIEHEVPVQITTFPIVVKVIKSANVRAGPGTEYAVISGARPGQRLTVLGCNSDCSWYLLAENCWIAAFLVKPEEPLVPQVTTGGGSFPMVVVSIPITVEGAIIQTTRCPQTVAQVNTYAGPGAFFPVVETRPPGECVAVVGRNSSGDWLQLFHGTWIVAAAILYADPIEILPVTDRIFTATPEPTHTPHPTATPTPTPTPTVVFTEILTVGEWMIASQEHKAAMAFIWTLGLVDAGIVTADPVLFAAELLICVDTVLDGSVVGIGESYSARDIAAGCAVLINQ